MIMLLPRYLFTQKKVPAGLHTYLNLEAANSPFSYSYPRLLSIPKNK